MDMDINMVYLWVDGNDPAWQAKRNALIGMPDENSPVNCKGRYANNDELKYSLRSVEQYAPWIKKIFIVTDNQIPEWLDTNNPKVKIIDHREIMPPESLPCFNSSLIEHFLYRIPGLEEHFLIANDDTFINKNVSPEDFFTPDGRPIIRLTRKPLRKLRWFWREKIRKKPLKNYSSMIAHSSEMVEEKFGHYYSGMPHHNIDAYLKSDYRRMVEDVFCDEFKTNNLNKIRSDNDVHRSVISYAILAMKHGILRYVTQEESMHVMIHKERHYARLDRKRPMLFCMNDSEYATDEDRMREKAYLEKRFPKKASFEK